MLTICSYSSFECDILTTNIYSDSMKIFGLNRRSTHFVLLFMFLLTFIILLMNEVSFTAYKKHHELSKTEQLFTVKTEESTPSNDNNIPTDAVWQNVSGSRYKFFVYSAYLDRRSPHHWLVRLIGATKTRTSEKPTCTFHYLKKKERVTGKIETISEHWGLSHSAVFILCALKNNSRIPHSVSVSVQQESDITSSISNRVIINADSNDSSLADNTNKICACVKPIHNFDQSLKLIEFIELSRLLGISHFTFYNASAGPNTSCILNEYSREGIASIYTWQLDIESQTEIRTEGMFSALNDCLYRNMHIYPYVAFIDIDEFIVPRLNMTLMDLITWLNKRYNTRNISSYSFQNAFFYLQWADDVNVKSANVLDQKLISIRKTRRKIKLNAHRKRSKFIVKPKNVVEVGNHFVWQFFYNHNTLNVPSNVAILNHYRVCEFGGDDCVRQPSVVDRTIIRRYKESLTCKVAHRLYSVSKKCTIPTFDNISVGQFCSN